MPFPLNQAQGSSRTFQPAIRLETTDWQPSSNLAAGQYRRRRDRGTTMARTARTGGALLTLALALAWGAGSSAAQEAAPKPDTRLTREVALEIRAAELESVLAQLSSALGVKLDAEQEMNPQRITVFAPRASIGSLQNGLAGLLKTEWRTLEDTGGPRYRLLYNTRIQAQANELRAQRRLSFVRSLLTTEQALRTGTNQAAVAAQVRAAVQQRLPHLPHTAIEAITPDYLRQTLLLFPLRLGMSAPLIRSGSVAVPFRNLPPAYQVLMAGFYTEQRSAGADVATVSEASQDLAVLESPSAELAYRLLYGDHWAGTVLLTMIGAPDVWATAMLPSALYAVPDYASLYPEATVRPTDTELGQEIGTKIDTSALSWDQAITAVAREAKIQVLSDSYPRPALFRPEGMDPVLIGSTLGATLDRLSQVYGYVWWKQGDWYLFRHRMWAEEQRVSVPERLLRSMGASLAKTEHLSPENLMSLAALSEEQLLTLHLYGSAGGKTVAPLSAFNLDDVSVARAGLIMYGQMTEPQRQLATGLGLPFPLMSPTQQVLFVRLAAERDVLVNPNEQDLWKFRLSDQFQRERLAGGWAEIGRVKMTFDYGQAGMRTTELAIRTPAAERPTARQ